MSEDDVYVAKEQFAEVVRGAQVVEVDPDDCIPFVRVRGIVKSGVARIKFSYAEREDSGLTTGAVSGAFLPTVVELNGVLHRYVIDHLMSELQLNEEEAKERARSRRKWYGVVDGCHRLHALWELLEENPDRWRGFRWCVMLLPPGQPMAVLRAFARGQNLRQSDDRFVETTLFDLLQGLKDEMKILSAELGGRVPSCKELAESYSASVNRASSTLRNLALLALRLSDAVVKVIGEITNAEEPLLACSFYAIRGKTQYTADTIAKIADCRVYRHFLTASCLRQATSFTRRSGTEDDEVKVNALYRLKEISRLAGYKPVSHRVVNEQYMKAANALRESEKFEHLLQSTKWPRGLERLRENLLRNTVLDEDVERNLGNDSDILPPLLEQLRLKCPGRAPFLEARYQASLRLAPAGNERDREQRQGTSTRSAEENEDAVNGSGAAAQQKSRSANVQPEEEHSVDKAALEKAKLNEKLGQLGLHGFQMTWQQYNQSHYTTTDALFDLIITEPPNSMRSGSSSGLRSADECIDNTEMDEFVAFARRVLVPGGHVILFTSARNWREWIKLFRSHDFLLVDYPFVVVRSTSGLQRTNLLMFPQNICDFAVMAATPGKHPKGFKVNFEAPYNLISCEYKRKFAIIDNVSVVKRKLRFEDSRAPVRLSEQNPDVLAELIVTFSPEGARVLDPYAGTMATAVACMETNRSCVLVEKDAKCYQLAFERLGLLCESYMRCSPDERPAGRRKTVTNRNAMSSDGDSTDSADLLDDDVPLIEDDPRGDTYIAEDSSAPLRRGGDVDGSCGIGSSESGSRGKANHAGDAYYLLVGGEIVGQAEVQRDWIMNEGEWMTRLHGRELSEFAKDDEYLVVIWKIQINDRCREYRYPYSYGGIEAPVSTLGEMSSGFYAWDLHSTSPIIL